MIKIDLIKKLLSTNIFIENEYFNKYIDIIMANELTEPVKNITNSHHILPKCYFKHNNLPIDNNSNNKVNLKLSDHILAHYYLYNSAAQDWFKYANLLAIQFCLNFSHKSIDITEDWLQENLINYSALMLEKNKLAEKLNIYKPLTGDKNPFYGKHHSDETKRKISLAKTNPSALVRKHISDGAKNRRPVTKETLAKRSANIKLAHQNSANNGYKDVGKKISETKKLNKSGNNLNNKIIIINLETKQKKYIVESQLNTYSNCGWAQQKIRCLETNLIFNRLDEASQSSGISKKNITRVCNGERKSTGGYHWEYYLDIL